MRKNWFVWYGLLAVLMTAAPGFTQVGVFDDSIDYVLEGSEKPEGDVFLNNGVYELQGSGADFAGPMDEGFFVYTEREGSWQIEGKFIWIDAAQPFARCGLMIRADAQSQSSANYFASIRFERITTWAGFRLEEEGTTNWHQYTTPQGEPSQAPEEGLWMRLTRIAPENYILVEHSTDGTNWFGVHQVKLTLPETAAYGLAIESHTQDSFALADVSDVDLKPLAGYAVRAFSVEDYIEGEPITINLEVSNLLDSTQTLSIEDSVPDGWTISDISHGGTTTSNTISWETDFQPGTTTVSYQVTPTSNLPDFAGFDGVANDLPILGSDVLPKTIPVAGVFDRAADWIIDPASNKPVGEIELDNDIYLMFGSGADIAGGADEGFFVYKMLDGSWSVEGKLTWLDAGQEPFARCGVMVRSQPQNISSANYFASIRFELITTWAGFRLEEGGATNWFQYMDESGNPLAAPEDGLWMRVSRFANQNLIVAEASLDGNNWFEIHQVEIDMPETVAYGFAITSHYKRDLIPVDNFAVAEITDVEYTQIETSIEQFMLY